LTGFLPSTVALSDCLLFLNIYYVDNGEIVIPTLRPNDSSGNPTTPTQQKQCLKANLLQGLFQLLGLLKRE